jgi:thioester reductase-like protein
LFFELPTVNALTEYIKTASSGKTENHNRSNFTEDASLDASIQRHVLDNPKIVDPKAILLTGSTGFLGTHILEQLLQSTEANIYCLVREEEGIDAHERLMKMLTRYGIGVGSKSRKIKYVPGDLSKPRLGCSKDLYSELCQEVDIIYHNGAWVNHVYDYKILKQTNVDSTKELLKIATLDKQKAIYYISTLVAANDRDSDGIFEEGFPLQPPQNLISGYQQTKWISEKLLHEAYQRQIPVGIFRPSTITGHEETGICSFENDHFLRLIKGCIQMGCAPYSDELIDLLPVNFVSKFIVSSSLKGWACNKVFNITSPNKIKWVDLIHWLKCNRFKIELIPAQEWKVCLRAAGSENALFPLLSIYLSDDIEHARHLTHKNRNVIEMLNKLNMEFPTVSNERLESYFKYLRDKKFVESNS